ncbi:hypothetical protein G8759_06195 [Spirosoma aureum]|uniref:Uncharacterized protein n=1 Tax=Spirosoma aureum TaxID=2692134 RepID=A0A6G9AIF0_9BACT|nr:hypothetical protein [Spirosoma aureum]QIP12247.1 hypothetical protein G8759_06195 [Spirosoma aureum]
MYKYHRPDASLDVHFSYRKSRSKATLSTPDARPTYDCSVYVSLTVGHNEYGPYATG